MDANMGRKALAVGLLVALAAAAGCDKKIRVRQYPHFYTSDLKTVAVVPLSSPGIGKGVGRMLAGKLAAALRSNGTYRIVHLAGPESPPDDESEQAADAAFEKFLAALRAKGDIDAVIIGSIEAFEASSYRQWYPVRRSYGSYYGYRRYRGPVYYYDYEYTVYNEATVAVWAAMVRVDDGEVLHSVPSLIAASVEDTGVPDGAKALKLLDRAADRVVAGLVEQFAIVAREVRIDPGKDFRSALQAEGGRWERTDKFDADHEAMYLLLRLPDAADRNSFEVKIRRDGSDAVIAGAKFVWDRSRRVLPLRFAIPDLLAAGQGPGRYVATFYSQDRPIMRRKFRIREPKN